MSKRKTTPPKTEYGVGDLLSITYKFGKTCDLVVISRITPTLYHLEWCDGKGSNALPHRVVDNAEAIGKVKVELVARG
jgi:hypothetical protein